MRQKTTSDFRFFCLTVPKTFVEKPFCAVFQKASGSGKSWIRQGEVSRSSVEKFFVSKCQKISHGNFSVLCLRKSPVAKKFMDKREGSGGIKIFCRKAFVSHCRLVS